MVRLIRPLVLRFDDNVFCFDDNMATSDTLIRARSLTGFGELVRSVGGDPDQLLRAAGIVPSLLDEPEATLPLEQMGRLLASAAREFALPDFGMRLAQRQDITVVGAIAIIALYSPTFGAALRSLARYWSYHTPGGVISLLNSSESAHMEIRYEIDMADGEARRQAMELSFVVFLRFLGIYAPQALTHTRVRFRHAQILDGQAYREYLRCPVSFEQDFNAVLLPPSLADEPMANTTNEALRAVAERYISSVVRRFPLDIGQQVRTLAERQLANGMVSISQIAAQLNFHPRTLQRRLAAQGLGFDQLLDDLRRERARELLGQHAIPLSQVSELLGYGQQSTFIQASHRWFGMSPGLFRQRRSQ